MELRTLQYFLAVTKEENITRAAESLHISQPYLSKQLMELENEFGKQLLIRGKRKITLTEDGIILRKRAEEILSLVEKTEADLSSNNPNIRMCIFNFTAAMQLMCQNVWNMEVLILLYFWNQSTFQNIITSHCRNHPVGDF